MYFMWLASVFSERCVFVLIKDGNGRYISGHQWPCEILSSNGFSASGIDHSWLRLIIWNKITFQFTGFMAGLDVVGWERDSQVLENGVGDGGGGSGLLEIAIINFTFLLHDSHLTYYLQSDWKMLYHLFIFTYVFSFMFLLTAYFKVYSTNK